MLNIKKHRHNNRMLIKNSAPTSNFETDISSIAFSTLQIEHPKILDKLMGFQLTDFNEDDNKGVGFCTIKLSKKFYYIPIFFINGDLKPLILLYHPKKKVFYPLTKDWINFFESQQPEDLGSSVKKVPGMGSNLGFDFKNISSPPTFKQGSLKLESFLKEIDNKGKETFLKIAKENKNLINYLVKEGRWKNVLSSCKMNKKEKDKPNFTIINNIDNTECLTSIEKLGFWKNGYAVKDNRDQSKLDKPLEMTFKKRLTSPEYDGVYSLVTTNGITDCIIAIKPFFICDNGNSSKCMIIDPKTKKTTFVKKETLLIESPEDNKKKIPSGVFQNIKSMKASTDKTQHEYVIYNHKSNNIQGNFSVPFIVTEKNKYKNKIVFTVYQSSIEPKSTEKGILFNSIGSDDYNKIFLHIRENDVISKTGNEMFLSPDTKVIKIDNSSKKTLNVLTNNELESKIYSSSNELKYASLSLYINGKHKKSYHHDKEACVDIAKNYNLSIKDVQHFMESNKPFLVKKAMPQIGHNPSPYLMTEPIKTTYTVPSQASHINPSNFDKEDNTQDQINQLIALSEHSDVKVFDEGMIASLSSLQSPEMMLKKYLPEWLKALDKLGNSIFLIWYHGYKIKQQFSINEFSEVEDLLVDTFVNLGKIILKIYKKDLTRGIM